MWVILAMTPIELSRKYLRYRCLRFLVSRNAFLDWVTHSFRLVNSRCPNLATKSSLWSQRCMCTNFSEIRPLSVSTHLVMYLAESVAMPTTSRYCTAYLPNVSTMSWQHSCGLAFSKTLTAATTSLGGSAVSDSSPRRMMKTASPCLSVVSSQCTTILRPAIAARTVYS